MIENPSLPGTRRLCPFSRIIITRSSDQCLLLLFTPELFLLEKLNPSLTRFRSSRLFLPVPRQTPLVSNPPWTERTLRELVVIYDVFLRPCCNKTYIYMKYAHWLKSSRFLPTSFLSPLSTGKPTTAYLAIGPFHGGLESQQSRHSGTPNFWFGRNLTTRVHHRI